MFCIKCGVELTEKANFCPECGAAQNEATTKKFSVSRKHVFLLIGCVIVATIIALLFSGRSINTSPEKLATAVVEAMYEVDVEKMVQACPDYWIRENARAYGLKENATRKQLIDAMEKLVEEMDEQAQKVEIISCEVVGQIDVDDMLWDYYGMTREEYDSITDTAVVELRCVVDEEELWREVSCIEIDGKWYMLDMD